METPHKFLTVDDTTDSNIEEYNSESESPQIKKEVLIFRFFL